MSARLPLVINDGQVEQLQPGDTLLIPAPNVDISIKTNGGASPLSICNPVYVKSDGTVDFCDPTTRPDFFGLVLDNIITAGNPGEVQSDGVITAVINLWNGVIFPPTSSGLSPGVQYYLMPSPGYITSTPDAYLTSGQFKVPIGIASSTTEFLLRPWPSSVVP
jgi:hypothetical protein